MKVFYAYFDLYTFIFGISIGNHAYLFYTNLSMAPQLLLCLKLAVSQIRNRFDQFPPLHSVCIIGVGGKKGADQHADFRAC